MQIAAVWIRTPTRTLYYSQFDDAFVQERYASLHALSVLSVQYLQDIVVSKREQQLQFFVFGTQGANEVILVQALNLLVESVAKVGGDAGAQEDLLLQNFMELSTTLSEVVDQGQLLTDEVPEIFQRQESAGMVRNVAAGMRFLAKTIIQ